MFWKGFVNDGGGVQNILGMFGDQYDFRTTSTIRTPEQNRRVGGVSNSQHVSGTARDFSINGKTPDQVSDFLGALRGSGFEAFTHDAGSGEHVHAELPPEGESAVKCPQWMPATLCGGFKVIAGGLSNMGPNIPGTLARAAGFDEMAESLDNWMWRIALIIIGLILMAVAVYFVMKGPGEKIVTKVAENYLGLD